MRGRPEPGRIEVVDAAVADILRQKTPAEKIKMTAGFDRAMRRLLTNYLRAEFPHWDDEQIRREVVRRMTHE